MNLWICILYCSLKSVFLDGNFSSGILVFSWGKLTETLHTKSIKFPSKYSKTKNCKNFTKNPPNRCVGEPKPNNLSFKNPLNGH
jgi:hypothetical protein